MLAEDDRAPCGCRPVLTGYGLAHAKPLDVDESPNIVRGAEIAHWSPERLIDADNTKVCCMRHAARVVQGRCQGALQCCRWPGAGADGYSSVR